MIYLVLLISLLVFKVEIPVGRYIKGYWTSPVNVDYFNFSKAVVLIVIVLVGLVVMLYKNRQRDFKFRVDLGLIGLSLYVIGIWISFITSKDMVLSLIGFPDRYEGLLVLLSYIGVYLIYKYEEYRLEVVYKVIEVVSSMMSIIVIMQFMGLDLLGFITKADSIIYGTLYNSNYVGSYLSLTLPLIIYNHEYNANRLVYCLLLLLNILALIMSNSRSSLIAIVIGCIFMVIYERNRFINILNAFLTYVLCIFVLGVVYGYGGDSNYKLRSVVADDVKITIGSVESLKGIDVKGNEIQLKFNSGVDNIKLDGDKLLINKEVVQLKNNIKYNKLLRDYIILEVDNIDGNYIIRFSYKGTKRYKNDKLSYIYIGNEFKYLIRDMYICDIEDMNNRYLGHIGSGRFYIWFNSVKLIKDSIFKGYGADTFALHFNQYDLSNKFVYLYTPYILVDKPHNVYIKIAIENGLIGLVGLLLYIYYIVKNSENKMGLKYAVISYLVCSLFNDWSIGVTILLWVYLGVLSRYTKD